VRIDIAENRDRFNAPTVAPTVSGMGKPLISLDRFDF